MSSPTLSSASSRIWEANRDPTSTESEFIERGNFWLNTSTNNLFDCIDPTRNALVWRRKADASSSTNFSPTIIGTVTAGVGTYSSQVGRYQIINDMAFVMINLQWTNHTGSGNLRITSLPFQPFNTGVQTALINLQNITLPVSSIVPLVRTNGSFLDVYTMIAANADLPVVLPSSGILRLTASFFL